MKKVMLLLLLLVSTVAARSQELNDDYTDVYVIDAMTLEPIEGVMAMVADREAGTSDANGRLVFSRYFRNLSPNLVFFKDGYVLDSITLPYVPDTFYLRPLAQVLPEAVVSNKKSTLLLKSGYEYVVDYDFIEDYILVATYSGSNGKKAKLFVLSELGDTVAIQDFKFAPEKLFKSCVGKYYVVTMQAIYPLDIDLKKGSIKVERARSIDKLKGFEECTLASQNKFYYRIADSSVFRVVFAYSRKGDLHLYPFQTLHQPDVLMASIEDRIRVIQLLQWGDYKEAAHVSRLMRMYDKNAFKRIDVPMFQKEDSLLIFDFEDRLIHYYNMDGILVKKVPILFDEGAIMHVKVLQDVGTEQFYLWVKRKESEQNIYKIDEDNGALYLYEMQVEKPLVENIKIRDGKLYYLWQDGLGSTRQLYIQRNTIK